MDPVERSPQLPHLLRLAHELHLQIFHNVEPLDLFRLGQTCQGLRRSASDERFWRDALRSMCRENHLFEPSFPIDTMSSVELQRAALGPTRWRNKVHRYAKMGPDSALSYKKRAFGSGPFSQVHLVPGGRYLISLSRQSRWFITLWDLGVPTLSQRSEYAPEALYTLTIEAEVYVKGISRPVYHSSFLRFTASTAEQTSTAGTCHVYEIGPLPENREIREIRELPVEHPSFQAVSRMIDWERLAVHESYNTVVIRDLSREENAPLPLRVEDESQVFAFNHYIVGICKYLGDVSLWPTKDYENAQTSQASHLPAILPSVVLKALYPEGFSGSPGRARLPSDGVRVPPYSLLSQSQSSFTFDLVQYYSLSGGLQSIELTRYKLDLTTLPNGAPHLMLVGQYPLPIPRDRGSGASISNPKYSSGHFFMLVSQTWQQGLFGVISVPLSPINDASKWTFARIESHSKSAPGSSKLTLCPSTGRLVDIDDDSDSILILDFLRDY